MTSWTSFWRGIGAAMGLMLALGTWGSPALGDDTEVDAGLDAWRGRIQQVVQRVEAKCHEIDGQTADESAPLARRLRVLDRRLALEESALGLAPRRFWLHEGDASTRELASRQLSSYSQMASSLEARASRVAHTSALRSLRASAERARQARLRREREARHRRAEERAARGEDGDTQGETKAGTRRGTRVHGGPPEQPSGPRIVEGTIKGTTTYTLVAVPLRKDVFAEFTVTINPKEDPPTPSRCPANEQASSQDKPDPEVKIRIVSKQEKTYPVQGDLVFSSGEGETKREVKTTYEQQAEPTRITSAKEREGTQPSMLQLLRASVAGAALLAVVSPKDEPVTLVSGFLHEDPIAISGVGLTQLKVLLALFEETPASQAASASGP